MLKTNKHSWLLAIREDRLDCRGAGGLHPCSPIVGSASLREIARAAVNMLPPSLEQIPEIRQSVLEAIESACGVDSQASPLPLRREAR
jgi:hypothetical protein